MGLPIKKSCNLPGCDGFVVSHGLCDKHRLRLRNHGHTGQTRPIDWGKRESHPLYNSWNWHKRSGSLCKEWKEDFWAFVKCLAKRPTSYHLLRRINKSELLGPGNAEWVRSTPTTTEEGKRYLREYAKAHREQNPDYHKERSLKRFHNMTLLEYRKLHVAQGGVCAICGKEEFVINPRTGVPRELAVDHCHETGETRGLLCTNCNKGVGHFKDNIKIMEQAINYLLNNRVS